MGELMAEETAVANLTTMKFTDDTLIELCNWIAWQVEAGHYVPAVALDILQAFNEQSYEQAVAEAQAEKPRPR